MSKQPLHTSRLSTRLLLIVALSACSTGPNEATRAEPIDTGTAPSDTTSTTQNTTSTTQNSDTTGAQWTASGINRKRQVSSASTLNNVRAARHENFDRIVFTFDAAGIPSYRIDYIDRPVRACGSGEVVPLPGEAWLAIHIEPANAHDEQGRSTVSARTLTPQLPSLLELRSICDFEAVVEWVAAVRTPAPFRVLELQAPPRLVVDIRHR